LAGRVKKKDIVIVMGLKLNFILKNTKQIGINQTYQDSSSRTSVLKRNVNDKSNLNKSNSKQIQKSVDKNLVKHRVHLLRSSGGIPNKCSSFSRFSL
jgi:hypothetical protein